MRKIVVLDTNVLCVWLRVPGKDACGPDGDRWDYGRVNQTIERETDAGATFILPLACIIETGNHIAQAPHSRRERAVALADLIRKTADQESPWGAFTDQSTLWSVEKLKDLADTWPDLAGARISLGDATIKDVAEHYAQMGWDVEILTADRGLKAYEPRTAPAIPRRRRSR